MIFSCRIILGLEFFFGLSLAGMASVLTNSTDYIILSKNTVEDIKKFPIVNCQTKDDCPDYSNHCTFDQKTKLGVCNINVFCNKFNGCVALLDSYDSHKNENLIIDSFQTPKDDKDPNLVKCKTNSDCFSNICKQGVCVVDDADPIYNCVITGVKQSKINCGKAANQLCYDHYDCISNHCLDVCDGNYKDNTSDALTINITKFMGLFIFILLCIYS